MVFINLQDNSRIIIVIIKTYYGIIVWVKYADVLFMIYWGIAGFVSMWKLFSKSPSNILNYIVNFPSGFFLENPSTFYLLPLNKQTNWKKLFKLSTCNFHLHTFLIVNILILYVSRKKSYPIRSLWNHIKDIQDTGDYLGCCSISLKKDFVVLFGVQISEFNSLGFLKKIGWSSSFFRFLRSSDIF